MPVEIWLWIVVDRSQMTGNAPPSAAGPRSDNAAGEAQRQNHWLSDCNDINDTIRAGLWFPSVAETGRDRWYRENSIASVRSLWCRAEPRLISHGAPCLLSTDLGRRLPRGERRDGIHVWKIKTVRAHLSPRAPAHRSHSPAFMRLISSSETQLGEKDTVYEQLTSSVHRPTPLIHWSVIKGLRKRL